MIRILLLFLFISTLTYVRGQHIESKLLDEETLEPVPYATIQYSPNQAVMSNEEGTFEVRLPITSTEKDSLIIASLGYKTKRISLKDSIPKILFLKPQVYEIDPVILSSKNLNIAEIIDHIKDNIAANYQNSYLKNTIFSRQTFTQKIKKFNIKVKRSSIDNINQTLFDTIVNKIPKEFTSLVESYANSYIKNNAMAKINLEKVMLIQSKHDMASIRQIQDDFFSVLKNNTKPNSYLIIKSGIIRLDKTDIIDSIVKPKTQPKKKSEEQKKKGFQHYAANKINTIFNDLFINKDSSVDFLNKSNRYEFTKEGFIEIGNTIAYIINFKPSGSAKYKGTLYVNTEDYAIIRAEVQAANKIFDKHFNMFGITSNELTYSGTFIFSKSTDTTYYLKYLKISRSDQNGVDRPIKIIEKNKYVKGRRKQNEVTFNMNIEIINHDTKELIFSEPTPTSLSVFEAFKPDYDLQIKRANSYDSGFWQGYNIISPEQAVKDIKIE